MTPGKELEAWLTRTGKLRVDVAEELRISRQHLHNIIAGHKNPSLALAKRIEDLTGIPTGRWGA